MPWSAGVELDPGAYQGLNLFQFVAIAGGKDDFHSRMSDCVGQKYGKIVTLRIQTYKLAMKHLTEWAAVMAVAVVAPVSARGRKAAPAPVDSSTRRLPNIVFVLTDDLGIGDIGAYGQRTIPTPHIDSLARAGMQFMQHYSGSTVSAPSRAVLLTGKHTGHSGIRGNDGRTLEDGTVYDYSLPAEEVTVAEILRDKGYATGITGKWGLGGWPEEGAPEIRASTTFSAIRPSWTLTTIIEKTVRKRYEDRARRHAVLRRDDHAARLVVHRPQRGGRPAFLPGIRHHPAARRVGVAGRGDETLRGQVPGDTLQGNWYGAQSQPRAAFAAMVKRIDDNVGRLTAKLRETGQLENTIFIFSSDNGTHIEGGTTRTTSTATRSTGARSATCTRAVSGRRSSSRGRATSRRGA